MHETKLTEIGALKQRLLTMPPGLYEARLALGEAQKRLRDAQGELKDAEAEEALLIASDKAAYPNDGARKAALTKKLAESAVYQAMVKRADAAEADVLNASLTVQRLEDEQRSWRAVVDLTCKEIDLLVAGR